MSKVICVYSSSSWAIDPVYFDAATALGREIAAKGHLFLFGGGLTGLMGACARSVHQHHGHVIGIIPAALNVKGIVYDRCDELVVTKGLRERKAAMDERSDAFIALPGGYGTLEEILEIITLKQLQYHNKPVAILNINHFYDNLLEQFETIIAQQFAKTECQELYFVTGDISSALDYIDSYEPPVFAPRWLTAVED
ncbi:TIGR00730 family Rossman fold protein [Sporomusa termitida]|uniref:Cytokinin riboside 5'-monophosphate phosphoribohydrolase n=1 Tax=Sporomusa termitida TaxID=2377 RepID=A0A517DWY8_9FIRM|nr:TIGR00730 family Rossman fold protein [Sporomusa termitida]QDR81862.1 LOG family protein YvdD [Sporomusa termitida]